MGAKRSKNGGGVALFKKIVHVPHTVDDEGKHEYDWFIYHDTTLPRKTGEYYMWIFHWICANGAVLEQTRTVRPNGRGGARNSWRHTVDVNERKHNNVIKQIIIHAMEGWKEVFNGYTRPGTR